MITPKEMSDLIHYMTESHRNEAPERTREIVALLEDKVSDLSDSATPDALAMLREVIADIRREYPDAFSESEEPT